MVTAYVRSLILKRLEFVLQNILRNILERKKLVQRINVTKYFSSHRSPKYTTYRIIAIIHLQIS